MFVKICIISPILVIKSKRFYSNISNFCFFIAGEPTFSCDKCGCCFSTSSARDRHQLNLECATQVVSSDNSMPDATSQNRTVTNTPGQNHLKTVV